MRRQSPDRWSRRNSGADACLEEECVNVFFFSHHCLPRASPATQPCAVDFAGIESNEKQRSLRASMAFGPLVNVTVVALAFYDEF